MLINCGDRDQADRYLCQRSSVATSRELIIWFPASSVPLERSNRAVVKIIITKAVLNLAGEAWRSPRRSVSPLLRDPCMDAARQGVKGETR